MTRLIREFSDSRPLVAILWVLVGLGILDVLRSAVVLREVYKAQSAIEKVDEEVLDIRKAVNEGRE